MPLQDLAYAARTLRKSPVFTITAMVTIALGIGASTAIFSVTNAVLLRPLPYTEPQRLVFVCQDMTRRNVKNFPFSSADFLDLRKSATGSFQEFAGITSGRSIVPRDDGTPEQVRQASVTPNFLRLLGANIAFGRNFEDADGQPADPQKQANQSLIDNSTNAQGQPAIAILSYEFFVRRFGADPAILNHGLVNGGRGGARIVGVLAPGFELLFPANANIEPAPDIYVAARVAYDVPNRDASWMRVIARLRPNAAMDRAQPEADIVSARFRNTIPLRKTTGFHMRIEPMQQYLVAEVRPAILALMGAVIFLLLIACANVANLLLVRASLRERELAVRTALGGSRWRLVRQMLAESVLLAAGGTTAGIFLAWAGIRELQAIAPANLPRIDSIAIDPAVLVFSSLTGLAVASLIGIVPALRASRPNVALALRASGRSAGLGGGLLRNGVVVTEVALSFVLLIGSGLMFRSFMALQRIDPGFDPHGVLVFQLLGGRNVGGPERQAFVRSARDKLAGIPGVTNVTAATPFPLAGGFYPVRWGREEALTDATKMQAADYQIVLPGYFEALRTPLIAGRTFNDSDNMPERKVVVIDDALAAKAYPHESAVGKRILTRAVTPQSEWVEIIGVVAHERKAALAETGREQIYFTDGFMGHGAVRRWAVRTTGDPAGYAANVRTEIGKLSKALIVNEIQPMDALVAKAQAGTRFSLLLIGVFAVIALVLAGVGLYGVLSTVVRQRTAEIGVRMALGAGPKTIFNLVVGQGLSLSAIGVGIGLIAAFFLTQIMTSMLVGVKPADPPTYVAVVLLFLSIAALASWLPARRAAALDPNAALRDE